MCVVDGRFKEPHLARVRLIRLWGRVRRHTRGALEIIKAHKYATAAHTRERERGRTCQHLTPALAVTFCQLSVNGGRTTHLLLAVLEGVQVLGQLLVLPRLDALGLVAEPGGVLLLQPLDGLLLLPLQVLHLLVVLTLLTLRGRGEEEEGQRRRGF